MRQGYIINLVFGSTRLKSPNDKQQKMAHLSRGAIFHGKISSDLRVIAIMHVHFQCAFKKWAR